MKIKLITITTALMLTLIMSGCSKNNEVIESTDKTTISTEQNENNLKENQTNADEDKNIDSNNENNTSNIEIINNSNDNVTNDDNSTNTDDNDMNNDVDNEINNEKEEMMKHIKEEAINGVNIYCDNIKLGDNISNVEEIYGKASEHNYVSDAKGIYYNYKDNNFAFGCNKGDQIFEIRSYDKNMNKLSLTDIESYFGEPDYENKTTVGERIIGYKVSEKYKILFVFNNDFLDHYSVFYPEITANLMANDEGREW